MRHPRFARAGRDHTLRRRFPMQTQKPAAVAAAVSSSSAAAGEFGPTVGSWLVPPLVVPLLLGLAVMAYALLRH
jgi:hypothetical protein